jgi:hypothetical protein
MGIRLGTALTLLALSSLPSFAENGIACRCLYQGRYFEQGETVCIRVNGRDRLARCDMELNNSSWTFLQNGCPSARMSPAPPKPVRPKSSSVSLL